MQLTDEEKRMLDGDFGAGVQKAMRMIVKVGELFFLNATDKTTTVLILDIVNLIWTNEQ